MVNLPKFIRGSFSGYALFLILLSAFILIFSDRRQLKQTGLKKEAKFSLVAGIIYTVIAVLTLVMSLVLPSS